MGFFNSNKKKRTIKFWKLWDTVIANYLTKDESLLGDTQKDNFYVDMKGFYSGTNNITYLYTIDGLPSELDISFRNILRNECSNGVRLSFVTIMTKHTIKWNSSQMRSKLKTWEILEQDADDINEYNLHSNLAMLDSQRWRRYSLTYLSTAEIRRKRKTFKTQTCMFISGVRGEDFDDAVKDVLNTCELLGIRATRVMHNVNDYLDAFSPFKTNYSSKIFKDVGMNVATDELIARFNSYNQGTVGYQGIYWGTDIYSGFPCLKPVKVTTETAENWLITAETGGGKSFFIKGVLLQLLGNKNYNGTIMDVEGFEYLHMAYYVASKEQVQIINMAEGTGAYFDPVEIVLTGDEKLDADMYNLSLSFTVSMFKTLLGNVIDKIPWVSVIIEQGVANVYKNAGVVANNMATWGRAKGLTVFDVYNEMKSLVFLQDDDLEGVSDSPKYNEDAMSAKTLVLAILSSFFEEGGIRRSLFKERVSVSDIRSAKLVICSFGMAGKSEKAVDEIQMALMQLGAANISHLRSIFSKYDGKYNFKLWEEFQRWGKFPDSDKTVGVALTGGRKLGDINIVITNNVKLLLDDDKFGIFGNTTSFAVGCIWDSEVRERLCERLSLPQMIHELDLLVKENKDLKAYNDGDITRSEIYKNPYAKAFLIGLDKTVFTLSKMIIPEELAKTEIFRTGITLAKDKKDKDISLEKEE